MKEKKILVFAGSARAASVNKKLAIAASKIAEESGAEATCIDLADFPADIYNGDEQAEKGIPDSIRKLKQLMAEHDGFIVVCPEYNGHITPLLCNTLSWASRSENDEKTMIAFAGKKAAIMAASPGKLGGVRVIPRLRDTLAELGVMVVPGFVTLPNAMQAFDETGTLINDAAAANAKTVIERLIQTL